MNKQTDPVNHGMPFGVWWQEVNRIITTADNREASRGEARYYFEREHWPATAARLILGDRCCVMFGLARRRYEDECRAGNAAQDEQ